MKKTTTAQESPTQGVPVRFSQIEKADLKHIADSEGYPNFSEFLRDKVRLGIQFPRLVAVQQMETERRGHDRDVQKQLMMTALQNNMLLLLIAEKVGVDPMLINGSEEHKIDGVKQVSQEVADTVFADGDELEARIAKAMEALSNG